MEEFCIPLPPTSIDYGIYGHSNVLPNCLSFFTWSIVMQWSLGTMNSVSPFSTGSCTKRPFPPPTLEIPIPTFEVPIQSTNDAPSYRKVICSIMIEFHILHQVHAQDNQVARFWCKVFLEYWSIFYMAYK